MADKAKIVKLTRGNLEPGLEAAIDLLKREASNEENAGANARRNHKSDGFLHRENAAAYRKSVYLLEEQRIRILG